MTTEYKRHFCPNGGTALCKTIPYLFVSEIENFGLVTCKRCVHLGQPAWREYRIGLQALQVDLPTLEVEEFWGFLRDGVGEWPSAGTEVIYDCAATETQARSNEVQYMLNTWTAWSAAWSHEDSDHYYRQAEALLAGQDWYVSPHGLNFIQTRVWRLVGKHGVTGEVLTVGPWTCSPKIAAVPDSLPALKLAS